MSTKKHEWTRKGVTASMAVVLAFGMTPASLTAWADESTSVASEAQEASAIGVSSESDLVSAVESATSGTVVFLESDIELSDTLMIPSGVNVVLDLADHTLSVAQAGPGESSSYAIENHGALTVRGSSEDSGAIRSRGVKNYGSLTLESGSIVSFDSNGGGAAVWNEGDFIMTGGVLSFTGAKDGNGAGTPLNNQPEANANITGGKLLSPYTCLFSSGNLTMSNIQLQSSTEYWMTVKLLGGFAELNNVTIETTSGGCIENSAANVVLKGCNFKQAITGNPTWTSVALAVSNGGTTTVESGTYSGSVAAAYVYSSGGTFNLLGGEYSGGTGTVLKADNSDIPYDSAINVYGGTYVGSYSANPEKVHLNIMGGSFSDDPTSYLADGYTCSSSEGGKYAVNAASATAAIGEAQFASINDAVAAATNEAEVKILANTSEDVVIQSGKNVTLNLGGHTLTNSNFDTVTIANGASLDIVGNGTVDNKTNGRAAVYNNGAVDLKGGTYDRTSESGQSADISGDNSWYTICNHGEMTIDEGAKVKNSGGFSSMMENGYYDYGKSEDERSGYVEGVNSPNPKLTINGGTFEGGLNAVKNDDGGILVINDGSFINTTQSAVLNWNEATISGGTFDVQAKGQSCVLNGAYSTSSSEHNSGKLEITGGTFKTVGDICLQNNFTDVSPVVTGGSFSSDPSAFVPSSGYRVVESDGTWTVSEQQSGGGTVVTPPASDEVTTENPDGSTTTTVEGEDGSSTETTVSEDEAVTTVVEKDASGKVTKVEAEVSQAAVDAAAGAPVALPMAEPIEPAAAEGAPAISVKAPAGAKVAVPVAAAEGSKEPAPGAVLAVVDAEGAVTVLPKTASLEGALAAEIPGDCTLKVVDASADFPDVSEGDWFAYAADFASARGILAGSVDASGETVFDPSGEVTRGMFVAMLNRVESRPSASEGFEGFEDVPEGSWYAQAADWGAEQGVVEGVSDGVFGGDSGVTREQMALFMMRYAKWLGLDVSARSGAETGASEWAADAMSWAVAEGLIVGDGQGYDAQGGATRAEAATVVMRFVNMLA